MTYEKIIKFVSYNIVPIKIHSMIDIKDKIWMYDFLLYPNIGSVSEIRPHNGLITQGMEVILDIKLTWIGPKFKSSLYR